MIFVTGGTGLVGSHLIFELLKAGKKVKALTRKTSGTQIIKDIFSWNNLEFKAYENNLSWVEGDILDVWTLKDFFTEVEEVYHCAAEISFNPSHKNSMIKNNVEGTANLVNLSIENNIRKFCHISSVSALGRESESSNINESTQRSTDSNFSGYSISKFNSELEVWRGIQEGLNAVIVNPSIILGPGTRISGSLKMFHEVSKGMKFYTDGISGFVDVRDVVSIMMILMEKDISAERFCINSENLSFQYVTNEIAVALDVKPPSIRLKPWVLNAIGVLEKGRSFLFRSDPLVTTETAKSAFNKTYFSNEKIKEFLKYEFIPIKKSIHDTAKIFKQL